jgi:hypothetical protein
LADGGSIVVAVVFIFVSEGADMHESHHVKIGGNRPHSQVRAARKLTYRLLATWEMRQQLMDTHIGIGRGCTAKIFFSRKASNAIDFLRRASHEYELSSYQESDFKNVVLASSDQQNITISFASDK